MVKKYGMDKSELKALYDKIPKSTCKQGCFRCCADIIQFTKTELVAMGGYEYRGKCSHLVNGRCSVYENRPFVCRIYGVSEILRCENCTPDYYLTKEETLKLIHDYDLLLKKDKESDNNKRNT